MTTITVHFTADAGLLWFVAGYVFYLLTKGVAAFVRYAWREVVKGGAA